MAYKNINSQKIQNDASIKCFIYYLINSKVIKNYDKLWYTKIGWKYYLSSKLNC